MWDLVGEEGTGKGKYEVKKTLIGHAMAVLDLCFDDRWIISSSKVSIYFIQLTSLESATDLPLPLRIRPHEFGIAKLENSSAPSPDIEDPSTPSLSTRIESLPLPETPL